MKHLYYLYTVVVINFLWCQPYLCSAQSVPSCVPASGLLAWYPFNGNANNVVGNFLNGRITGATLTTDRFGNANSAYHFNGTTQRITIDSAFFNTNWSNCTFSFWINADSVDNPNNVNNNSSMLNTIPHNGICLAYNWLTDYKYHSWVNQTPGVSSWNILNNAKSNASVSSYSWTNIVFVKKNDTSYSFYINGVLDSSYHSSLLASSHFCKIVFGNTDSSVGYFGFWGKMDDIGIWNLALTDCDIYKMYNCITSLTPSVTISASPGNVVSPGSTVTFTAVSINGGTNPGYQWKVNGNNVGSNSSTFSTNTLNNSDIVSCVLTSNLTCATPTTASSNNVIIFSPPLPSVSLTGSSCTPALLTLVSSLSPLQIVWKQNGSTVSTANANWSINAFTVAGGNGIGSSGNQLYYPGDVCFDTAGNMYVTDVYNNRVMKYAPGSTNGTVVAGGYGQGSGANQLYHPSGIVVDNNGNMYIGDQLNNRVQKWAPGATSGTTVAGQSNGTAGNGASQFNQVMGIRLDAANNLYVCDFANNRVQKWAPGDTSGITVAGQSNGTAGSGASQLNEPWEVALDTANNIYVSDFQNHRVQKWVPGATSGVTVAGGYGAGTASNQLSSPSGIYVDGVGNLYIANIGSTRITRWAPGASSGTVIAAGNGQGSGNTQLSQPWGIVLRNGTLFVGDQYNNRVQKFVLFYNGTYTASSPGNYTATVTTFGGASATTPTYTVSATVSPSVVISAIPGNVISPGSTVTFTAVPANGGASPGYQWKVNGTNVGTNSSTYTSSSLNNGDVVTCVLTSNAPCPTPSTATSNAINFTVISLSLSGTTICPGSTLTLSSSIIPLQIQWKQNGNVVHTTNANWSINATTVAGQSNGIAGTDSSHLTQPNGICVDASGNVYVLDNNSNPRIMKWASGATSGTLVAGGNGVGSGANQFNAPVCIALDTGGNLYICDYGNNRIQKWTPGATSGSTIASVSSPSGLFIDVAGNIYVSEQYNYQVKKFAPGSSSGSVVAGGNGSGSLANQFAYPADVYVDDSGNIYVVDITNYRVQKWAPGAGSGTTVAGTTGNAGCFAYQINTPSGLWVDVLGNVYLVAQCSGVGAGVVIKWPQGATGWTTAAGGNGFGTSASQIKSSSRICFDAAGNLYVADRLNNRVQKFGINDTMTYVASGSGIYTATVTTFNDASATTLADTIYSTVNPAVTISALPGNYISQGAFVTFTAVATNGGTNPIYQWKLNGNNVGINSSIYSSNSLNNGDVVSCVLTSNAPCPSVATANSNSFTIVMPVVSLSGTTICPGSVLTLNSSINPWKIVWMQNGNIVYSTYAHWNTNATTVAGGNGPGNSSNKLNQPYSVFVNDSEYVYIADYNNNRIQKWAPGANSGTTIAGGTGAGSNPNQLWGPNGIYVDNAGNSYICDRYNSRIQKWLAGASAGQTVAGGGSSGSGPNQFNFPAGVFVDVNANVYIPDVNNSRVQKWAAGATSGVTVAGGSQGSGPSQLMFPYGAFADNSGNIYVSDYGNNRVQKWGPVASAGTTVAGSNGPGSGPGQFSNMAGIYLDGNGNIFVADGGNNRIQEWAPGATSGVTVAGGNGAGIGPSQLSNPTGVFVDRNGNLYVADNGNNRIQKFSVNDTMTYTAASSGSYTASVTTFSGASATTAAYTINTAPLITSQPGNTVSCAGTNVNIVVAASGPSLSYQWKADTGTGYYNIQNGTRYTGVTTNTLTLVSPVAGMNGYKFYCVISGPCGAVSSNPDTLVIRSAPSVISQSNLAYICPYGDAIFSVTATGAGLTYQWYQNNLPLSDTANVAGSSTDNLVLAYEPPYGNGNVYKCVITGLCSPPVTSAPVTLFIEALPAISMQPSAKTICAGNNTSFTFNVTSASSLSYYWKLNGTDVINGGVYSGANTDVLSITGAVSSMSGGYYKCLALSACGLALSDSVMLTVNSSAVITAQPGNTVTCAGTNTNMAVSATGASLTYQWKVDSGTGYFNIQNGNLYTGVTTNTLTIVSPPASMNGFKYVCQVSDSCGTVTSNPDTLTVNSSPSVTAQSTSTTVCSGDNTIFTVNATGAGIIYQWKLDTGNGFANISNGGIYAGATTNTLTITGITSVMNNYLYKCSISGTCVPAALTSAINLTVNNAPNITSAPSGSTACAGSNTSFSVSATGAGTYQWYVNTGTGFTALSNGGVYSGVTSNVLLLTGVTASMNSYAYKCIISGPCLPSASTSPVLLFVNTLPAISSQPSCNPVCIGNSVSLSVTASGTGLNYQWQVDTGSGFVNLVNGGHYSGVSGNTLSISGIILAMSGYNYRCLVSGACTPSVSSSSVSITVYTAPTFSIQPLNKTICEGDSVNFFALAGSGAGIIYQWQVDTGSGFLNLSNNSIYSGATSDDLIIGNASASLNGFHYLCIISGYCSPSDTSVAVTLTMNRLPSIPIQASNHSICAGANTSFSIAAAGTSLSYQWKVDTGGGFINIYNTGVYSNATTNTLTLTGVPGSMNGYHYKCIVSGTCSPSDTSNTVYLTVNTAPVMISQPHNDTVCSGTNASFALLAGGSGLNYQWQKYALSAYVNINNNALYSGANTNSLIINNAPDSLNGGLYRCLINGICTPGTISDSVALIVHSLPSITTQAINGTLCAGGNTSFSITATGTGITYQWQLNAGSGFSNVSNGSMYNGATTNTLTLSSVTSTASGYTYRCIVSGICPPNDTSNTAALTVNTSPVIYVQPSNSIICAGNNTSFTVSASGTALNYQWQVNTGSGFANLINSGVYSGATTNTLNITAATASLNSY